MFFTTGNYTEKVNVEVVKAGSSSGETTLKKLKVSGGGYAGIICGFVFVCAVTFFIIRAIRKRLVITILDLISTLCKKNILSPGM